MRRKIKINGQDYTRKSKKVVDEGNAVGEINYDDKEILISKNNSDIDDTILHELTYEYLYECGLRKWAYNEDLVNWIAHNFLEMTQIFYKIKRSKLYKELTE